MRILALLSPSFGLHKKVVDEIKRQGHEVVLYEDLFKPFDPLNHFGQSYLIRLFFSFFLNSKRKYWIEQVKQNSELCKPFDFLFCINGVSFCEYLYNFLRSINPNIKCALYTWDSNKYYHFFVNYRFFDKVYTFDPVDAEKYKIAFLPIYWIDLEKRDEKYKVFFIGSFHSDRFEIISKITDQLDKLKIKYYIKLFIPDNLPSYAKIKLFLLNIINSGDYFRKQYQILNMPNRPSFVTCEPINNDVFNSTLSESEIVIDTEQPQQTGLTGRMMMALGNNKRIITTNTSVKYTSFYDENRILIVDRMNPVINPVFFQKNLRNNRRSSLIETSRLDRWVKLILSLQSPSDL